MTLLKDKRCSELIDKTVLDEAFEGYELDINNFFLASYEFLATKEVKFGEINIRGDFRRKNLVDLNKSLKKQFKFIK